LLSLNISLLVGAFTGVVAVDWLFGVVPTGAVDFRGVATGD